MLTDRQRHRLAKEARKLAMECVAGMPPPYGRVYETLRRRAGVNAVHGYACDGFLISGAQMDGRRGYAQRLVFPLMAYADAIDARPRAAPFPTPNTRKER